jgi:NAD(P)-dependent dehydrogenase (short-subunit alcohol dehydrogenase family)
MLAVNLTGVFLCLKHEIAQMLKQGSGGAIVNTASIAGLIGLPTSSHYVAAKHGGGGAIVNTASIAGLIGLPTSSHYVAAKHGVVGLTKTAAMEYAQDGIRVNCVNPGYIKTPMTDEIMKSRYEEIMAKVPMHRLGSAEEIAEAVVWMCSDRASFMTGASHLVDGGFCAA